MRNHSPRRRAEVLAAVMACIGGATIGFTNAADRQPLTPEAGSRQLLRSCDIGVDPLWRAAMDMTLPHEARPNGVPTSYDWSGGPRVGFGAPPPDRMHAATMWGQVYAADGGNPAGNTRIHIKGLRLHVLSRSTGQWSVIQSTDVVHGAAYREDFSNDENVQADVRPEPGGGISVKLTPGRNFHFWPGTGRATIDPTDVAAMHGSFEARLVVDDAAGTDDRAKARLVGSGGGDYWIDLTTGWLADWSANGDFAIGRFKFVCDTWRTFSGHTLSKAELDANPPPIR